MKHLLSLSTIAVGAAIFLVAVLPFAAMSMQPSKDADNTENLIEATPIVQDYASNVVRPVLGPYGKKDKLTLLLNVADILIDAETGVQTNQIKPSNYIIYDKLEILKLGFFITFGLSPEQKENIRSWRSKYMRDNPADVFFAPSADEIIKARAAFGCSHYARSFISVVKALDLIGKPEELRYVVSCKADDYNNALEKKDYEATINGHQFVLVKIDTKWIAINTSKGEFTKMPEGFSPDAVGPPRNVSIRFASYPDIVFALRKIGTDYNDDCGDNSLRALMNIYRSGDAQQAEFKWNRCDEDG